MAAVDQLGKVHASPLFDIIVTLYRSLHAGYSSVSTDRETRYIRNTDRR
jgi:hypothetical protein